MFTAEAEGGDRPQVFHQTGDRRSRSGGPRGHPDTHRARGRETEAPRLARRRRLCGPAPWWIRDEDGGLWTQEIGGNRSRALPARQTCPLAGFSPGGRSGVGGLFLRRLLRGRSRLRRGRGRELCSLEGSLLWRGLCLRLIRPLLT